jgi:hypothetical protein
MAGDAEPRKGERSTGRSRFPIRHCRALKFCETSTEVWNDDESAVDAHWNRRSGGGFLYGKRFGIDPIARRAPRGQ